MYSETPLTLEQVMKILSDDGNQPRHYFAGTVYRWQRGRTLEQAVENLLRATPQSELRGAILYDQGLQVQTYEVLADMTVAYGVISPAEGDNIPIPHGVELVNPIRYNVISLTGRKVVI